MSDQAFTGRLDELLSMPDGWILSVIRQATVDQTWYCTLSGRAGDFVGSSGCASAEEAILVAKGKAMAKNLAKEERQ